jgi:hypothetical protein
MLSAFCVVYRAEGAADGHPAEADDGDLEPGIAKLSLIHSPLPLKGAGIESSGRAP